MTFYYLLIKFFIALLFSLVIYHLKEYLKGNSTIIKNISQNKVEIYKYKFPKDICTYKSKKIFEISL